MGFFSKKESKPKEEVIRQLLAMNNENNPYKFSKGKDTDIIVKWKVAKADYIKFFGKEKFEKDYTAYMLLDDGVIKYFEEVNTDSSSLSISPRGKITFGTQKKFFAGKSSQFQTKKVISWAEILRGKSPVVIDYTFSNERVKGAVKDVAKANGWKFQSVASKDQILK